MIRKYYLFILVSLLLCVLSNSNIVAQRIGNYVQYGKMELEKENFPQAIKYFNQAIRIRPASYEGYFLRGYAKYRLDDYIGAEHDFSKAAEFDPYNAEIYHYRAIVRSQQYNFGGSLEDYDHALEIDKKNPYYYLNRARTYYFLKDYEKSIDDCNNAIKYKYTRGDVYILRGMAKSGLELYEKALGDLNIAIKNNPDNGNSHVQRGIIWMALKEPDSAMHDFNIALGLDNNDSYALFNLAIAKMETKDTAGALADLNRVIELSPYNSFAYYNRAILNIGAKKENDAIEDLDKVIALNPDNIVVYLFRGRLKHAINDLDGALADFSKAIEIYPDFADAYYERSQVKKRMMDLKGAEEDYNMAYAINEFNFNDTLKLEQAMFLKRLIAFSGEFYSENHPNKNIQDQQVDINPQPIFVSVLFSKNIDQVQLFDTFGKEEYYTSVVSLTNNEENIDRNMADKEIENTELDILATEPDDFYKLAMLYEHTQNYKLAIKNFSETIVLDPNYIMAYFDRANTRFKLIELINSANDYEFSINENQVDFYEERDTTRLNKTYKKVLADFDKVIEMDPNFYYAWFNRAYVKSMIGDYWGAVNDFSKALELRPNLSEAYFNKGLILIFLNLKSIGCENISTAGELGITDSYHVMKRYCTK